MRRILVVTTTALALVVLGALPTLAGGWAVGTIHDAPTEFEAGETYQITYTILGHGQEPVEVDGTGILFTPADGDELRFAGSATGNAGEYVAEVTVPTEGTWKWHLSLGFYGDQSLGTTSVSSGSLSGDTAVDALKVVLPLATLAALALLIVQIVELVRPTESVGREAAVPRTG